MGKTRFACVGAAIVIACSHDDQPPAAADPCAAPTFSASACQAAHSAHGYYWYGVWHPMMYAYPYAYYYGGYNSYLRNGGHASGFSSGYTRSGFSGSSFRSSSASPMGSGGTVRGGFGSVGAAHASGSYGG